MKLTKKYTAQFDDPDFFEDNSYKTNDKTYEKSQTTTSINLDELIKVQHPFNGYERDNFKKALFELHYVKNYITYNDLKMFCDVIGVDVNCPIDKRCTKRRNYSYNNVLKCLKNRGYKVESILMMSDDSKNVYDTQPKKAQSQISNVIKEVQKEIRYVSDNEMKDFLNSICDGTFKNKRNVVRNINIDTEDEYESLINDMENI